MCRNIRTLHNFDPPANEDEVDAAALQYVRKVSGFTKPSQANTEAFDRAVAAVTAATHELLGDHGLEIEFTEQVTGNASPFASPLADAIRAWIGEQEPAAEVVPVVLPAFTDSRTFRHAFPECVAYGFFPQREMTLGEMWPLVHGKDERIAAADVGFAARAYTAIALELLA